jgi:hypothetical protein
VPESSAVDASVVQLAPVEHQAVAAWPAAPRRGVRPPGAQEMAPGTGRASQLLQKRFGGSWAPGS